MQTAKDGTRGGGCGYVISIKSLTYNRTGLLDRPEKAWLQDGGNMRVFAHEVIC